jgi:hypothetical protein
MLLVGLVHVHEWELPEEEPAPRPRRTWQMPWRLLAWVTGICALMALVSPVGHAFGGLAGYGVLLLAVTLGFWRAERWCDRQYWRGLRDYQA